MVPVNVRKVHVDAHPRACFVQPEWNVDSASHLDHVTSSGLAQHLAHVAEPIPGPAEQLRSLADVHRGVARHSRDRELELTDLLGDGLERLKVNLALCGGGRCRWVPS